METEFANGMIESLRVFHVRLTRAVQGKGGEKKGESVIDFPMEAAFE
jgi:hypothetical protein